MKIKLLALSIIRTLDRYKLGYLLLLLSILFINTLHVFYPDEFDNILGGWYIAHGRMPYTGFFTHHGPVAYFVAAFIVPFSGQSFVWFRYLYALFIGILLLGGYYIVRKKMDCREYSFYLLFLILYSVASTYFWGHMLLADSLAGYLYLPIYAFILFTVLGKRPLTIRDLGVLSALMALTVLSSLTYIYLIVITSILSLYIYYTSAPRKLFKKENLKPILVLAAPYLIFLVYLLLTGSLVEYYKQNIAFNAQNYVYNYPRATSSTFINPIRYAIVIAHQFYQSFHGVLVMITRTDAFYPFNTTLAVSNAAILIFLVLKKHYTLAAYILGVMIYSNARSDPLASKETDYQSAVYITISLFNGVFVLRQLAHELNNNTTQFASKLICSALLLIVGFYCTFNSIFIIRKFFDKAYNKYMGTGALIYNRPQLAPIINAAINNEDYMWIGPFDFEDLFYAKGKLPSRYHILIPAMGNSPTIMNEMINDFKKNKPKVVIFDQHYFILGKKPAEYAKPFISYLDTNYVKLLDYRSNGLKYVSVKPIELRRDVEAKMYINKDHVGQVIEKLLKANIIKPMPAN